MAAPRSPFHDNAVYGKSDSVTQPYASWEPMNQAQAVTGVSRSLIPPVFFQRPGFRQRQPMASQETLSARSGARRCSITSSRSSKYNSSGASLERGPKNKRTRRRNASRASRPKLFYVDCAPNVEEGELAAWNERELSMISKRSSTSLNRVIYLLRLPRDYASVKSLLTDFANSVAGNPIQYVELYMQKGAICSEHEVSSLLSIVRQLNLLVVGFHMGNLEVDDIKSMLPVLGTLLTDRNLVWMVLPKGNYTIEDFQCFLLLGSMSRFPSPVIVDCAAWSSVDLRELIWPVNKIQQGSVTIISPTSASINCKSGIMLIGSPLDGTPGAFSLTDYYKGVEIASPAKSNEVLHLSPLSSDASDVDDRISDEIVLATTVIPPVVLPPEIILPTIVTTNAYELLLRDTFLQISYIAIDRRVLPRELLRDLYAIYFKGLDARELPTPELWNTISEERLVEMVLSKNINDNINPTAMMHNREILNQENQTERFTMLDGEEGEINED